MNGIASETKSRRRWPARADLALATAALAAGALALATAAPITRAEPPVAPGGVRTDGIAAIVGAHANATVILRSEVALRARIALSGRAEASAAFVPLPVDLLRATLDQMIGEALIAREAERVRVTPPTDADLAAERARLEEEAGSPERLAELARSIGALPAELDAIARRRALVGAFLRANLEGATVVTDGEVERAFEAGDHPFGDLPLEQAREPLRAFVARQTIDRAVRRWVTLLRTRTEVRVLSN